MPPSVTLHKLQGACSGPTSIARTQKPDMRLHEVTRLNMSCTSEGPVRTLLLGKLGAAASPLGGG